MKWHVYTHLSHCSGIQKKQHVLAHIDYLLRQSECKAFWSNTHFEQDIDDFKNAEKSMWKTLNSHEKRTNSRLQSRLVIPLPNSFTIASAKKIFDEISALLNRYGNVHSMCALHQGGDSKQHRNGAQNLHLHIDFSDRDYKTFKKIRALTDMKTSNQILQNIKTIVSSNIQRHGIQTGPRSLDLMQSKKFSYKIVQKYRKEGVTEHREYQEFLSKQALQQQIRAEIKLFNIEKKKEEALQRERRKQHIDELDKQIFGIKRQRDAQQARIADVLNPPNALRPKSSTPEPSIRRPGGPGK